MTLVDWDPDAEVKVVTAMLYPYTHLSEEELARRVVEMTVPQRMEVMDRYAGERANRRHRPGRALERSSYRFDVVSDYGAFRDLQRHRLLTIEWQALTPYHGYTMPEAVTEAGAAGAYEEAMGRSASLYEALEDHFGATVAAYAVTLAHRVRYSVQMNAREAMHMLELRTTPQGHPEYRKVCQKMHRLIADKAGHSAIAGMMTLRRPLRLRRRGARPAAGRTARRSSPAGPGARIGGARHPSRQLAGSWPAGAGGPNRHLR